MCNKCCQKISVSYDTIVVEKNATVKHRNATSIYFTNKSGVSAFVNQIEVGVGETTNQFKNDPCEKIVSNFEVTFGPEDPELPFPNRLYVTYEWKKIIEPCKN